MCTKGIPQRGELKTKWTLLLLNKATARKEKKNSKGKIELARVSHCRGFKIFG